MTIIDPSTVIPLYYQIKEDLMKEIETGKWAVGEMIPSEIQLAHKYNVSSTGPTSSTRVSSRPMIFSRERLTKSISRVWR